MPAMALRRGVPMSTIFLEGGAYSSTLLMFRASRPYRAAKSLEILMWVLGSLFSDVIEQSSMLREGLPVASADGRDVKKVSRTEIKNPRSHQERGFRPDTSLLWFSPGATSLLFGR